MFPKLTDLFDVRLKQLSPYKDVEVKTNNGLLTDLNDSSKEIEKRPNSGATLSVEAAEQGDAGAQCELGLSYVYGVGVQSNCTKAVEWFGKSANTRCDDSIEFKFIVIYKSCQ